MATGGSARALGMEASLGTIRENRAADIVVLNRDPSNDLDALRDVAFVMKGGDILWANPREPKVTIVADGGGAVAFTRRDRGS
jgi:imidazolonepropionase-like amidohydrolase